MNFIGVLCLPCIANRNNELSKGRKSNHDLKTEYIVWYDFCSPLDNKVC